MRARGWGERLALAAMAVATIASGTLALASPAAAKTVTLQFWTIQLKPTFDKYINGLISSFEKQNPGVTVDWTDLPYGTIEQKLLADIAAGSPPDVVNLNTQMAIEVALKGGLEPVNNISSASALSQYVPSILASARIGKNTYAYPWYMSDQLVIYNARLFADAKITKPPTTWAQAFQDAYAIHKATGAYGMYSDTNLVHIFSENNIRLFKNGKAAFDTPAAVKLLTQYGDAFKAGALTNWELSITATGYYRALDQFEIQRLGMLITGPQFLRFIKSASPGVYKNTHLAMVPRGTANTIEAPAMDLVVPKNDPNAAMAGKFALFVTNAASQLAFDKLVPIFPSAAAAIHNSYFTANAKSKQLQKYASYLGASELKYGQDYNLHVNNPSAVDLALNNAWESVLLQNATPSKALYQAALQVDAALKQ